MSKTLMQFKTRDGVVGPLVRCSTEPGTVMLRPVYDIEGSPVAKKLPSGGSAPEVREYRLVEIAQLFLFEEVEAGEA